MNEITDTEIKIIKADYLSKILFILAIFATVILLSLIATALGETPGKGMALVSLIALLGCFTIGYIQTHQHRMDLKHKKVFIEKAVVQHKTYKMDYEPGSVLIPF